MMVDCRPGYKLVESDSRGCGGNCVESENPEEPGLGGERPMDGDPKDWFGTDNIDGEEVDPGFSGPEPTPCPVGCTSWFDGCNTCTCDGVGKVGGCTKMMCFRQETPECRAYGEDDVQVPQLSL